MVGVRMVGITLALGLMLEGVWLPRLQPYFALYWFVTVGYCLAFGSTLALLGTPEDSIAMGQWLVNLILLAFLVDSMSFLTLSFLGVALAMVMGYLVWGSASFAFLVR